VACFRNKLSGKHLIPVLFKIQQVTPRMLSCWTLITCSPAAAWPAISSSARRAGEI
jgi:hypothetical protein